MRTGSLGRALAVGALVTGCTNDLAFVLDGKQCSSDGRCVEGYVCDAGANLCVPLGRLLPDGAGGDSARGAGGSAGRGGLGGAHGGGRGGGAASGGAWPGGASGGSAAGSSGGAIDPGDPDGGPEQEPDRDAGCVPTTVYHDGDGDGFGDSSESRLGCPSADWVTRGDDCRDDQAEVFPHQTAYFRDGYPAPKPGGVSFDYDCSNTEDPDPTNDTLDPSPMCGGLLGLGCSGSGYDPASPPRDSSGADGVEPRCGSNLRTTCQLNDGCKGEQLMLADRARFRCR